VLSIIVFLAGVVDPRVANEVAKIVLGVLVKSKVNGKDADSAMEKGESADADGDTEVDNAEEGEGEGENEKDADGD
jgi:hypothetical protein